MQDLTWVTHEVDHVLTLFSGETTVTDSHDKLVLQQQLTRPFDFLVGDDEVTKYMVSPIRQSDPSLGAAYRDVLVVAFTEQQHLSQRVA